jgi:hypothetical protein
MCTELLSHPDCAVIGPAVVNEDGSIQGSARGDPDMSAARIFTTRCTSRLRGGTRRAGWRSCSCAHVAGGCCGHRLDRPPAMD